MRMGKAAERAPISRDDAGRRLRQKILTPSGWVGAEDLRSTIERADVLVESTRCESISHALTWEADHAHADRRFLLLPLYCQKSS